MIRLKKSEEFNQWVERVTAEEMKKFQRALSRGEDMDKLLEQYSENISKKIMHYIFLELKESAKQDYDLAKDIESYNKNYLSKTTRPNDHVSD